VPVPAPAEEEVDVELVTGPEPAGEPFQLPMPVPMPVAPAERPFWPPDRRDWIMGSIGAICVLSAVGVGYGLARLLRRKPDADEEKG
jgi:hypothetical protein